MPIEMRPAIPAALPHAAVARGRWERLLGWLRAAVTVLAATVAVVGAAMNRRHTGDHLISRPY
jgi:hypothetical protein